MYLHNPHPHPDTTADWHAYKQRTRSAHQAIEDKAIDAYHKTLESGGSKKEAEEQYSLIFQKIYNS
jgi:hypothetical protein